MRRRWRDIWEQTQPDYLGAFLTYLLELIS